MSAILLAVFEDHDVAVSARTSLVKDGFPTDRVTLVSTDELGAAALVPRETTADKLTEYFNTILHSTGSAQDERSVQLVQHAVLEGHAALTVQPRGDVETRRALELINERDPIALKAADLESQSMEHAAAEADTPVLTWMGKVLAAPGAPDTTGTARLP